LQFGANLLFFILMISHKKEDACPLRQVSLVVWVNSVQEALDEPAGDLPVGAKKDWDLEVDDYGKDGSEERVRVGT
jgi:hypothetical protein